MIIMPLCQKHQIAKHSETVKLCMQAYGVAHAHVCVCVFVCVHVCVYSVMRVHPSVCIVRTMQN